MTFFKDIKYLRLLTVNSKVTYIDNLLKQHYLRIFSWNCYTLVVNDYLLLNIFLIFRSNS
jgi:hypothetical protein